MKRIFLVVALAFGVAGCAQMQAVGTGISLATKSIANPVTKTEEAQVELAVDTAIQALLVYKRACVQGTADVNCRDNIHQIQAYTRQVPPLVAQLRHFVDTNDQVNATVVYNELTTLYVNVKNAAAALGVNLGAKV
jgi:predicted small secreted protein